MLLYTLSKTKFFLLSIGVILSLTVLLIIGLKGPNIVETSSVNSSYFLSSYSIASGPFVFLSPSVTLFNQQLWLLAHIKLQKDIVDFEEVDFNVSVLLFPIDHDGSGSSGLQKYNRTRSLKCENLKQTNHWCSPIVIMHLSQLHYAKLKLEIQYEGLQNVSDVSFEFKTYNQKFTQFEIWFRFSFVAITFILTGVYGHMLKRFHLTIWTLEQKWLALILPSLLLYNNPFFPLNFLYDSLVPGLFDIFFQATFTSMLLIFWLFSYHGLKTVKSDRNFISFYLSKVILCTLFWVTAILIGFWQKYNETKDPTYHYKVDLKYFTVFKVFFFILIFIYFLYFAYLFIGVCLEVRTKAFYNTKMKFMAIVNACIAIICAVFLIVRFTNKLISDNFVASLAFSYKNSVEFVFYYGFINIYIYILLVFYLPSMHKTDDEHNTLMQSNPPVNNLQGTQF